MAKAQLIDINEQILKDEPQPTLSMNPKKFAMWLFIASIVMIFASLTSAYIVRRAEGNWVVFDLPPMFYISSTLIVISSATMHWALLSARKNDLNNLKLAILLTTLLGAGFCIGQFIGFSEMIHEIGVYLVGNPSGSFVYILVGLHVAHLVGGITFLLIVLFQSFTGRVNSSKTVSIEMCSTFWHFLGGLWLYLFLFLLINR
jgi:cytochrome c oxidase subunit III